MKTRVSLKYSVTYTRIKLRHIPEKYSNKSCIIKLTTNKCITSQTVFIRSKLTIETLEQGIKYVYTLFGTGVVLVSSLLTFEHISQLLLVFLLLTLNM